MTKFIFFTSGAINYSLKGLSLFDSILTTSLGVKFPCLKKGEKENIKRKIKNLGIGKKLLILSASTCQARQTARVAGEYLNLPISIDKKINPVLFDFEKIMKEDEFNSLKEKAFDISRQRFLKAFFNNQLSESKMSVKKRIDSFFNDYSMNNGTVLVISHSFLMMILKAYLTGGDEVFKNYNLLRKLCRPQKRPFDFLSGFKVNFERNIKSKKIIMLK